MIDDLEKARDEIERLEHALGYLASCTAATAEHLLSVKSSSKAEKQRHLNICRMLLEALGGKHLRVHYRISDQVGVAQRLSKVVEDLSHD